MTTQMSVYVVISYDEDERDQNINTVGVYQRFKTAKRAILYEIEKEYYTRCTDEIRELLEESNLFDNLCPGDISWKSVSATLKNQIPQSMGDLYCVECRGISCSFKIFKTFVS